MIRDELASRGHDVWFDRQRLEPGGDWEAGIEAGLEDSDKVVLLMTPHAVRQRVPGDPTSTDGFCLNEIAKAQQLHKTILPVMVKDLPGGPPTSICRIQWLDLTECPPSTSRDLPRFRELLEQLFAAVERDELDFAGRQSRLLDLLRPLDYGVELSRHIGRFRGREWLIEKVDRWLQDSGPARVLWLLGKPGLGKTAFATFLCHRLASAWHVCVHDHEDKSDPRRAVLSLAYQLSMRIPEYRDRLVNKVTAEDAQKAATTVFDDLILAPLTLGEFPDPGRTHLVVIDAIDEASGDDLAQLVANRAPQLPPWLRLVVTSRPDPELEESIRDREPYVETFEIDADGDANRADLREYVTRELAELGHRVADAVIDAVVERSEGLFLYASRVIKSLREGLLSVDRLTELPTGIRSWYRDEFHRRFTDADAYEDDLLPVLNLVIAQRAPIPVPLVQKALDLKRRDLARRLRALGSLFEITAGTPTEPPEIMPVHKTLSEWLGEISEVTGRAAAGRFAVDVDEGHECLADYGWGLYGKGKLASDPYCERFLPDHLMAVGQGERVRELLCDLKRFDTTWSGERRFDAMRYWRAISDEFDPAAYYLEALDRADPQDEARFATRIGSFLLEMGLPREATPLIKRAVELRSGTTGEGRLELAESLRHLADAYREQSFFTDAHPLYEQALEIVDEERGSDSPEAARVLYALTILLWKEKRHNEALAYNHRALQILESTESASPRHLADCINDMGVILRDMVPGSDVTHYFRRALRIFEEVYGPNDPGVAHCFHNLALSHPGSPGREDIAELERARRVLEATFVAHHPDNQTCRRTLASHYELHAEFAKAVALCETVLRNEIASFGATSPTAQQARAVLARTKWRQRRASALVAAARGESGPLAAAVRELERRVDGEEAAERPSDPDPEAAFQLAAFLQDCGYQSPAALVYESLLDGASALSPKTTTRILRRYAVCLGRLDRRADAVEVWHRLLERPDLAAVRKARELLAKTLFELGRHEEAREELRKSVALIDQLAGTGEAHAEKKRVAQVMNEWAMELKNRHGQYEEAEPYYRLAMEFDSNDGTFPGNLALLLTSSLGRHDEAEQLYRHSFALNPNDPVMIGNYGFFLHHVRGDVEGAEERYREALIHDTDGLSVDANYAALLLITGRPAEALDQIDRWWAAAARRGHDHLSGRVLLTRIALERSRAAPADFFLGQLKFVLAAGVLHAPWKAEALFRWLDEQLDADEAAFLRRVGAAISSKVAHDQLENDPRWKAIPFTAVAEPWPQR